MVLKIEGPVVGAYFVTSDKPDPQTQRSEMTCWAETHGYRSYDRDFVYTIYRHGQPIREWRLVRGLAN
ncbi:hypothetical protein CCAX7_45260 [Capsulimonas corticalis]|uniref:Uncharacterized protein n=1 Tax=Capsulimonas corticalis TaxID=2219043 RepID=A0A402D6G4_9BACT|nr:hypothetical protein [Capsulimonas corticalis]BDI32475.1 hypothetical protein CCAX7_45260 [Capsulimonas corticalis]